VQFSEYARQQSQSAPDPEIGAYWLKRFEKIPLYSNYQPIDPDLPLIIQRRHLPRTN